MVTMVKLAICAFICSFGVIVVFCIMVYLMTTINPPPINLDEFIDKRFNRILDESIKSDDMIYNDAVLPVIKPAQFGLEKFDADEIDFYQSTGAYNAKYNSIENISVGIRFTPRKIIQPLWPRQTQMIVINIPSVWPTTLEKLDTMSSSTVKAVVNGSLTSNDNITNDTLRSKTNKTIIKLLKRSVNNNKSNVNSGSVILKILDNEAEPRIEIKLGSDMLLNIEKPEGFMSFLGKRTKLSMPSEINGQRQNGKLAKDTIISIMPNDSIIIDEFESKPVFESEKMDIKDLISSMISIDETDEENNDYPLYEDNNISHNVVFDNKNIYLRNMVANSSNFEVANSSHINGTKTINITENSTEFHTLANTKINNTKLDKRIEGDGSTISVTNVVKKQGNDTILGNTVVFTNATDFLNKNDSDLVVY